MLSVIAPKSVSLGMIVGCIRNGNAINSLVVNCAVKDWLDGLEIAVGVRQKCVISNGFDSFVNETTMLLAGQS